LFRIVLISFFFFLSSSAFSQKKTKLEIINSELTIYDASTNPDMRRLLDSVIFKHNTTTMFCDSAWHYFKENKFEAFGNIHINKNDSLHLYGNHLDYIGNEGIALISGDIIIRDNTMTLWTDKVSYNLDNNIAYYNNGATIINKDNKLVSKKGKYYSSSNKLEFKTDVELINPDYIIESDTLIFNTQTEIAYFFGPTDINSDSNFIYCENGWYNTKTDKSRFSKNAYLENEEQKLFGDSLIYDRKIGYGLALNNISIIDTTNNFIIKGQKAELFEKNDSSIITLDPLFIILLEEDSLFLHSDTIVAKENIYGENEIKASTGVKFYNEDIQGKCIRLYYNHSDSTIKMQGSPILWSDEYQMTADSITVKLKDNNIDKLLLIDNSFIVSSPFTDFYDQIKGKSIIGYFVRNKMKNINVFGNGQVTYTLQDEQDKISGINTVSCSFMNIDIDKNKINRISFQDKPESIIYPTNELPLEWKKLNGFVWRKNERVNNKNDIW
jgi:lipopolysaccharide export system protein LptA